MENLKKSYIFLRALTGRAGACFMTVFVFFAVFAKVVLANDDFVYDSGLFGYTLLFSFIFAAISLVISEKLIPSGALRIIVRYALSAADFVIVLCYLSGVAKSGKQIFVLTLVFTVIYAAIAAVSLIIRTIYKKRENNKATYVPKFTHGDDKK